MNLQVFRSTLPKLMSENNEIRLKAEEEYKDLLPQLKLQYLIFLLGERVEPPEILHLSSILLRRVFRVNIHCQLKEAGISLKPYKDELINILKQPIDLNLKKKIADAAAEFEKKLLQSNSEDPDFQWPEFLSYLFECVVSPDANDKEIALNIISYSPTILQKHIYEEEQCSNLLKQFLVHCVSENTYNIDFRISAVEAASAFIQNYYHDVTLIKQFYEIIVHFINLIIITLRLEEDYCDTILKAIQDIVEKCSFFLKPNFDALFRLCVETMLNNEIVESRRNLCLEIIASLSEYIPSTIRKRASQYLPQIINHLLTMMTDIEDDLEEWTNADEVAEEDYDSNVVISETSLDRLATGLGGRTVLPIALQIISSMCANRENWKYRYAGLMAVATIGEGCHDQMIDSLDQIVYGILPFLEDNHPKIRYAACNAIGQLATDFQPTFQNEFHFVIMPKLVTLFSTSDNPRVQAHALAALVNFLEGCSTIIINKHIDVISEKIEQLLNIKMKELAEKGKKLVLEQTIVALSSLADSAQENFIHYYDKFFPLLKFIIENALSDDLRILRGKTIECISLIGLAVGKEKFCSDATDIMNFLLRTQTGDDKLEADDPLLVYIIASWARICKILGPDFEPYLPYVMPSILKVASWKIEVTLLDKEEIADVEDNDDIQCLDSGEETFSVKTTGLEEKATACQMIICYARELKHAFANYVEETVKIMIPLLNFYFHERIRSAAAESLPFLIESGKAKGENFVKSMWDFIFKELIKSIESEPEKEVLCDMMSSLASCIESIGKANITVEQVDEITAVLKKYLEEHFENVEERFLRRRDEDYDEGVEETLINENDEDCYIMSKISEVIHSLFFIFNEAFIPYFEILLPLLIKLADPERSYTELQWVICTMDDLVEFTGPHCIKYKEFFIPLFNNGVKSEYPEIRQSAAYGWGVLGKYGGPAFAQDCAAALPLLAEMVQAPDSRNTLNNLATENAISSITKIMHYNSSCVDINKILSTWFSWLPIYEDKLEVPFVLDFLLILVDQNHPAIVGVNRSQLVNVLAVIGENLHRQDIETDSELYQKICLFINSLKSDMNFLTMCFNVLSANHSTEIRKILNM